MILDRIERRSLYAGMGRRIDVALDYLARTDFSALAAGKHEIDGEKLFAMVQRYKVKPLAEARWENHRRYIDVQYVASGSERIGFAPWDKTIPVEAAYSEERDLEFFKASGILLPICTGMFAILTPDEIHSPCLAPAEPEPAGEVLKVVVKCLWEG